MNPVVSLTMKVASILLLLIGAGCKSQDVPTPEKTLKHNNSSGTSTPSTQKDNTVDSGLTVEGRGSNNTPDTMRGTSGLKVLPVTKIISRGNSKVSEEDLIRYMLHGKQSTDSSQGEGLCTSENDNESIIPKLWSKRIHFTKKMGIQYRILYSAMFSRDSFYLKYPLLTTTI